ncbi:hypothetical protein KOI35_12825 [Actinoplanes bogorensis]|uniref:Uncharacterized protein n=1 Tax=Paractinoplanes bogorensis TaxID=1610840 RepID=A0ABS5YQT8_9ACTN|nr:hypothetical protein [Actinoplanes bogorensis]MBU2664380.1 hypothetical protein [Actinoplanes bogorensis]
MSDPFDGTSDFDSAEQPMIVKRNEPDPVRPQQPALPTSAPRPRTAPAKPPSKFSGLDENPDQVAISLVGPTSGGKTTFLQAILKGEPDRDAYGTWRAIAPPKSPLVSHLITQSHANRFPVPTTEPSTEIWRIRGATATTWTRSKWGRTIEVPGGPVEFKLAILDPPGGEFLDPTAKGLTDQLVKADGLILLIDPVRMMAETRDEMKALLRDDEEIHPTFAFVDSLMRAMDYELAESGTGGMPQFLSVCVGKLDHPEVYRRADQLGLIDLDHGKQPTVPSGPAARALFENLCRYSVNPNDADLPGKLTAWFDNVSYHAASSIGFYLDPSGTFDPEDFVNVTTSDDVRTVRRAQPNQVWETLLDLWTSIKETRA